MTEIKLFRLHEDAVGTINGSPVANWLSRMYWCAEIDMYPARDAIGYGNTRAAALRRCRRAYERRQRKAQIKTVQL